MTLIVIFLLFTAGIIVTSSAENNVNVRGDNPCITENRVCPIVDGPDSIYFPISDCTKFCQCSNGVPYLQPCPGGLHFNPTINVCDWPENVGCINSERPANSTSTPSTTTTTTSTTTQSTAAPNACVQAGLICPAVDGPDSVYGALPDCNKFCQCSNGLPYVHNCPGGLHFNPSLNVCDWPENAGCTGGTTQAANTSTSDSTTTTRTEATTTPQAVTKPPNECVLANVSCPAVDGPDSVYAALPDCTKFCQCSNGVPFVHSCPSSLHFNPVLNVCDWAENAGCTGGTTEKTTTTITEATTTTNTETEATATQSTSPNECIQANVSCPVVDGPDSVYAPLADCTKFCQCSNGAPYVHNCPVGLNFNPSLNVCDWPDSAGCTGGTTQATNTTVNEATTTKSATTTSEASTATEQPATEANATNQSTAAPKACVEAGIECPAVDGPDSVYAALPDCTKFCQCSNGVPYVHNCPGNLHFNAELNVCDWPQKAGCTGSSEATTGMVTGSATPEP